LLLLLSLWDSPEFSNPCRVSPSHRVRPSTFFTIRRCRRRCCCTQVNMIKKLFFSFSSLFSRTSRSSGVYKVIGVRDVYWNREQDNKLYSFRVWYPAITTTTTTTTSSSNVKLKREKLFGENARQVIKHFARSFGRESFAFFLSHLAYVPTYSFSRLPLHPDFKTAEGQTRPIILFSPGLYGIPEVYTSICELLASKGFLVVAVRHTDGSAIFLNEKGELVYDFLHLPPGSDSEFRQKQIQIRVEDIRETMKYLSTGGADLVGNMKEQKIVMVGHSFGGGSVVEAVRSIPNVMSGVALDAWMEPVGSTLEEMASEWNWEQMKNKRFLFLNSELWQWESNLAKMRLIEASTRGTWLITTLQGSTHHSFDDSGMWFGELFSRRVLKLIGPLKHKRGIQCIVEVISDFVHNNVPMVSPQERTSPSGVYLTPELLGQFPEILLK